jgi:SAM-dependent methyltransferase
MTIPIVVLALLQLALWRPAAPAQTPEEVWQHFANWVRRSPAATVRNKPVMDMYTEHLVTEGLEADEARRRVKLISGELRQKSRENNALYWDAMFRFGGGPERPLALLTEVARDLAPGRAVDVAMGNGRNGLYLASLGWTVSGYDISPEGIALARKRAEELGAKIEIVRGGHREFEFGLARWDLILLSYIVADEGDLDSVFGRKLWDSLRPGGRIVCEGNFCEPLVRTLFPLQLSGLRLERYSDSEGTRDGWAADNMKGRVIRAVLWKRLQ